MAFVLQRANQAVDDLGVDAFENPGVVGVEQADAARPAAGKRPGPQIGPIAHLAGDLADALGRLGAAAIRLAIVAAENAGDGRARHAGSFRDLVNGYRHELSSMVDRPCHSSVNSHVVELVAAVTQNRLDFLRSSTFFGGRAGCPAAGEAQHRRNFPAASPQADLWTAGAALVERDRHFGKRGVGAGQVPEDFLQVRVAGRSDVVQVECRAVWPRDRRGTRRSCRGSAVAAACGSDR